ncbi:hypothetical protein RFI_25439 [Reticulomyxa filosa]|uniref:RanBP2-type domain-containing protein n=1 Tax=Reticulomyxa filosa TaxID=46433 RepID=X6ME68_RETFI|nr:hypothetical protein RFI_25439 [Reticulomyxa filosa]|eukprot:ETO11936.1 hypothetical protein RFI_25439 [Reticulomyxa filosa]
MKHLYPDLCYQFEDKQRQQEELKTLMKKLKKTKSKQVVDMESAEDGTTRQRSRKRQETTMSTNAMTADKKRGLIYELHSEEWDEIHKLRDALHDKDDKKGPSSVQHDDAVWTTPKVKRQSRADDKSHQNQSQSQSHYSNLNEVDKLLGVMSISKNQRNGEDVGDNEWKKTLSLSLSLSLASPYKGWTCHKCSYHNWDPLALACIVCKHAKTSPLQMIDNEKWTCQECTFVNASHNVKCAVCGLLSLGSANGDMQSTFATASSLDYATTNHHHFTQTRTKKQHTKSHTASSTCEWKCNKCKHILSIHQIHIACGVLSPFFLFIIIKKKEPGSKKKKQVLHQK